MYYLPMKYVLSYYPYSSQQFNNKADKYIFLSVSQKLKQSWNNDPKGWNVISTLKV